MKRPVFLSAFFIAFVSVILFSGQMTRPYTPPRPPVQTQQRQPVQKQTTPQKSATPSSKPTMPTVAEMPSLFWLPEDIQFPEGASPTITLFGDPKAEGLYVTRTLIPKGTQTMPHIHSDSRTVTVLAGICYYGRGEEFDENKTIPMPPGSFFTEPAGVPHFIWAKDRDVVVQTTAVGPSRTQIVSEKKPSATAPLYLPLP